MIKNKEMYLKTASNNVVTKVKGICARNQMLISGLLLCLVGLIACIVFPEDAMGGMFCVMMGIPVTLSGIIDIWFYRRQTEKPARDKHNYINTKKTA